jgi:hypothetical protein
MTLTETDEGDNRRAMWAAQISAAWCKSTEAICAVGQHISEAKAELPHGQFEEMIKTELPFGPRTARMLMAVEKDARISAHGSEMPSSWRTLYELTRLADEQFKIGIDSGVINPEMQRSDVAALCPSDFLIRNESLCPWISTGPITAGA